LAVLWVSFIRELTGNPRPEISDMDAVQIRYADLIRVYGRPDKADGYIFCPADLDIDAEPSSIQDYKFYLADQAASDALPQLRSDIRSRYDVAWTVARIMRVVFIEPEDPEDGRVIDQGFVAVQDSSAVGYPFQCRDFAGRSHLQFSIEECDSGACQQIARCFWQLLLNAPNDLQDFQRRVCGPEEEWSLEFPADLEYGCRFGHLYREKASDPE
jgi:hypothetical protein